MPSARGKALLLLAGGAALALAIPASGQDAPESLLPPGFGDPATLPPAAPAPTPAPAAPGNPPASGAPAPAPLAPPPPAASMPGTEGVDLTALNDDDIAAILAAMPRPIEIPDFARRPSDFVGPLGPQNWGLGQDAWSGTSGRYLSTLMRRLNAPLPSRWASILLRRALLTGAPAPARVNPVDWVAERAWLLLRMGEADGARMLVEAVDVDQFTPKMYAIAVQTALATADPAALCPLVPGGKALSDEPVWPLAEAMCAAISGEAGNASSLIDRARRARGATPFDISLAEKVVGAGADTRRAVTIEWDGVDQVNSWRFGMASATGIAVPDRLMNAAGPHVRAWQARAPMVPVDQRVAAADTAAALGVFSNQSLVGMYSLIADTTDPTELGNTVGGRLRTAYVAPNVTRRMEAMRGLWREGTTPTTRHARLVLTATAAARLKPDPEVGTDIDDLIASMLTAGYDERAARWSGVIAEMEGGDAARAMAMLAVSAPNVRTIDAARIQAFADADQSDAKTATKMLVAALAGLGRIDESEANRRASDLGIALGRDNLWTRMLDRAVERRQQGTVALLAAVGMQTGGWGGVPPEHMFRITSALRRVGLDYYARMIAAEALARL
ncbi:hypothetical protein [Allosphingosinicella indica]|uniref:Antifreeze protein n=1 Tax=Allosphingosinicella indica TaxID=941907 RepID=A0A1X7GQK8_9SPHN|nr:hypothetical protein [Allosphingosinicella indica]SMF73255.1 hypothetical protein SAMN06295910_2125 [Allosphingosinicella indica]